MSAPFIPCREVIAFLADYLDGVLPPELNAEFERHLAVCDSCVQYIATYRETIRMSKAATAELRIEAPPEDLVRAILAAVTR